MLMPVGGPLNFLRRSAYRQRPTAYPHELSGGLRQRVMIATAISCDPELLIADEPTTALDVTIEAQIIDLLRELQCSSNMSVIIVTHDLGVIADFAEKVSRTCAQFHRRHGAAQGNRAKKEVTGR